MPRFDSLDGEIIRQLQKDGRMSFVEIAKQLHVPSAVVRRRFNRMKKAGLIKGSTLVFNFNKLRTVYLASIGIRALDSEIDDVVNYIKGLKIEKALINAWTGVGRYNINSLMVFGDIVELHKIKQVIRQHPAVSDIGISLTKDFYVTHEGPNVYQTFKQ